MNRFFPAILASCLLAVSCFNPQDIVLRKGQTVLLPIDDWAPQAKVAMVKSSGDTIGVPWDIRLAIKNAQYVLPYTAPCKVRLSISNLPDTAVFYNEVRLGKASECYRNPAPYLHFKPLYGWTNDPNGLVYKDGEWHLFYQFNPFGSVWGNMTWGHAVSTDLVNWKHLPQAIEPDELGAIFSGSAVVDADNTAGFGAGAIVAIYTACGERQTQCIAYSNDNGRTFTKYPGNPVVTSEEYYDFRDPHVFWHADTQRWIMLTCAGIGINIYSSPNLTEWTLESHYGAEGIGCRNSVWECPDLFPIGDKWVLLISNHRDWINGQSTQYLVGSFDGHKFVADDPRELWVDDGSDYYAAITWTDAPDGRRVLLGWGINWQYANITSNVGWRGMMAVPREVSLGTYNGRTTLFTVPSPEVMAVLTAENSLATELTAENTELVVDGLTLKFDPAKSEFSIARTDRTMSAALEPRASHDLLVIFQDGLVECFIDGGAVNMTFLSKI